MATGSALWGCCTNDDDTGGNQKCIICSSCGKSFHYACLSMKVPPYKSKEEKSWNCPICLSKNPKTLKKDSTPIRNVTLSRGNKRQASGSPPPTSPISNNEDLRLMIQNIIKSEFSEMLDQFNVSIVSIINKELIPVREEMKELIRSMQFMNARFDEIEKLQQSATEITKKLEKENTELRNSIDDLLLRINNLEQHSRSNNLEIQCMPEKRNENLYNIVTQLGNVVNCNIGEKDILHCTRVAKSNKSNSRPRSIVVQLMSTKMRDQLLASILKYNQNNPHDKLNSTHLGCETQRSPVYVMEHLSPANKALHAATRIKAKEMGYKYVWVRNGKIFVRKTDGAEYIYISRIVGLRTKTNTFYNNISCTDYDIIILTETWLNSNILSSELVDDRYVVYRRDRETSGFHPNKDGGGVLIAVLRKFNSYRIDRWESRCEDLWVTVDVPSNHVSNQIIFCAVYHPPPVCQSSIEHFIEHCNIVIETTKIPICIIGDFNLGKINWASRSLNISLPNVCKTFLEFLDVSKLSQFNCVKNISGRTLDLVLSSLSSCSIFCSLFNTSHSLKPISDNGEDEIKMAEKYFANIPNIESKYIINEGLSKTITNLFKGKINPFPLYKISLTIDPKPVKIPWTLNGASNSNDSFYHKKYRYVKLKKSPVALNK
ncbi:unnamed protein product [Colias eurytheme]|nr:unnamed protein product [Colias eurytheme]